MQMKLLLVTTYHPQYPNRIEILAGLKSLGIDVYDLPYWNITSFESDFARAINEFRPHALLTVKGNNISPEYIEGARKRGIFTIMWVEHPEAQPSPWVLDLAKAHQIFFTTIGGMVEIFRAKGVGKCFHLMQGFQPEAYFNNSEIPKLKQDGNFILFTGKTHGIYIRRAKMLNSVMKEGYPVKWYGENIPYKSLSWKNFAFRLKYGKVIRFYQGGTAYLADLAKIILASRIVLGSQLHSNFRLCFSNRIWSAMGCGGFYLGEYVPGQEELFKTGVDLESFNDFHEMLDKIKFYWDKAELRLKIARSGQKKILENHTYHQRFKQMLKTIKSEFPATVSFINNHL